MAFEGTSEHPDCRPTARVVIGGTEVPTVNGNDGEPPSVEVQMRKTGVADLTRVAEVHVPYEWGGDDVFRTVSEGIAGISTLPVGRNTGFRDIGNGPVRVDILDDVTDQYVTAFHGAVNNVGPSTIDGAFRVICTDWANILETISFDGDYDTFSVETILRDITNRVNEHEGVPEFEYGGTVQELNPRLSTDVVENPSATPISPRAILTAAELVGLDFVANSDRSFHKYKHSVIDAIQWVVDATNTFWYVSLTDDNTPVITLDEKPTSVSLTGVGLFDDNPSVDSARVIVNNALFQIGPQYTLGGRGKKTEERNIDETGIDQRGFPTQGGVTTTTTVPEVIVQHDRLATIAGTNPNPEWIETNANDLDSLEQQIRKGLKQRMDDAAGGEIITLPSGVARPYYTIEAKPACNGRLDRSIPSITYEIEEVIHRIRHPTVDTDDGPRTILRCGIEIDPQDDFEVQRKEQITID